MTRSNMLRKLYCRMLINNEYIRLSREQGAGLKLWWLMSILTRRTLGGGECDGNGCADTTTEPHVERWK